MDIGVDASRQDIFTRGIDHTGSSGNDQMVSKLLDPTIFDVDVDRLRAVVVNNGPIFDEESVLSALQVNRNLLHRSHHFSAIKNQEISAEVRSETTEADFVDSFSCALSFGGIFNPKRPQLTVRKKAQRDSAKITRLESKLSSVIRLCLLHRKSFGLWHFSKLNGQNVSVLDSTIAAKSILVNKSGAKVKLDEPLEKMANWALIFGTGFAIVASFDVYWFLRLAYTRIASLFRRPMAITDVS